MKLLRLRLILLLTIGLGGAWAVAAWLGHMEARHEVDELFDAQLAQSAQAVLKTSSHEIHERLEHGDDESGSGEWPTTHQYEQKLVFQLWSVDGKLLQRSPGAPATKMTTLVPGYQTVTLDKQRWRVLTRLDRHGQFVVQVAEPYSKREWLARHIAMKILLPMLIALPVLALLIWWFVTTGLRPLRAISHEVQSRAANRLDLLEMQNVPDEVAPLVQALNGLFARLQHAFDSERRFTADAAHELRTPLAALKVQAQVAMRAMDDETRQNALEKVQQGVDRATHLTAQLLTLARVDPENAASQQHRLSLYTLAATLVEEFRLQAEASNIRLQLEGTDMEISGDADQLTVLLRNLLDNALRYTPQGGEVRVSVHERMLEVADTGPGIPPEQRERVLERFYRIPGNTQPGSGLGLSIVNRIAQLHGASVQLETSASGGLRVRVKFPHG